KGWQFAIKHAVDRVAAAFLILLLAPILIITTIAVALSSTGPIFYRQRRIGRDGRAFDLLKFRSMHAGEDPRASELATGDIAVGGVQGQDRRTGVGRLMRSYSIENWSLWLDLKILLLTLAAAFKPAE